MNLTHSAGGQALIGSVIEVLDQGEALLAAIENDTYIRELHAVFKGTIGAHYRHCLDHFGSLLDAASASADGLNYDHRERGTLVETNRFAALNATRVLRKGYLRLPVDSLQHALAVTCRTSYVESGSQVSHSTVGREIMYVVAHAVHHYA